MSVCRLCLSSERVVASLLDVSLRTKAEACRLVEIRDDELPQSVCETCESKVKLFYDFKVECDRNYIKLKKLFESPNLQNEVSIKNEHKNTIQTEAVSHSDDRLTSESATHSLIKIENDSIDSSEAFNTNSGKKLKTNKVKNKTLTRNFKSKYKTNCDNNIKIGVLNHNTNKTSETTFQANRVDIATSNINVKHENSLSSDFSISLKSGLSGNANEDAPTRPFQCELCGQTFKLRGILKKHLTTHSNVKLYACSLCPKRYTRAEHSIVHMRTHMGIKPFVCEICAQSFVKHQDLDRHKKIHSDEKKYSCKMCDKKFKRSGDVHPHMRTHTGVTPFACAYCFKAYKSRSGLRKHYSGPSCKSQTSDKKDIEDPECK